MSKKQHRGKPRPSRRPENGDAGIDPQEEYDRHLAMQQQAFADMDQFLEFLKETGHENLSDTAGYVHTVLLTAQKIVNARFGAETAMETRVIFPIADHLLKMGSDNALKHPKAMDERSYRATPEAIHSWYVSKYEEAQPDEKTELETVKAELSELKTVTADLQSALPDAP